VEGFGEGEAVPGGEGDATALTGFEVAEAPDLAGGAEAAEFFFEAFDFEADGEIEIAIQIALQGPLARCIKR
jgi:hypothetical protein